MCMKFKLLCIMLALSSTWSYAKPKFEDIRIFENSDVGMMFIINGNEKAILSTPAGVVDVAFLPKPYPSRGAFFKLGDFILLIDDASWNKEKQGYHAYVEDEILLFKPLGIYPKATTRNAKLLHNSKRFSVYEKNASMVVFSTDTMEVKETEKDTSSGKSFRDGSMKFLILGEGTATFYANAGSAPVEFYRGKDCLIFTETTAFGGKHVFIISDKYDSREMGFRYTYVRNTIDTILLKELIRTTSHGIAKVDY